MKSQDQSSPTIRYSPPNIVKRQFAKWEGLHAEIVQVTEHEPFEYGFHGQYHVLTAVERAERDDGETLVEGLPRSTLHKFSRTMTFIPAGHRFHGWQKPRVLCRAAFFYFDPNAPLLDPALRFSEITFKPRLFFFDNNLWETAAKLKRQIEAPVSKLYAEALGAVLAHELVQMNNGHVTVEHATRGGLAAWQQRRVAEYIEEHLSEPISLASLAEVAQLSPYHFSRAFKQSFGMPPHRYHMMQRIERAKALLAKPTVSVTEIALRLGFSETSGFTGAFRKLTSHTPSEYRKSLE